jgi:hypothetical protein
MRPEQAKPSPNPTLVNRFCAQNGSLKRRSSTWVGFRPPARRRRDQRIGAATGTCSPHRFHTPRDRAIFRSVNPPRSPLVTRLSSPFLSPEHAAPGSRSVNQATCNRAILQSVNLLGSPLVTVLMETAATSAFDPISTKRPRKRQFDATAPPRRAAPAGSASSCRRAGVQDREPAPGVQSPGLGCDEQNTMSGYTDAGQAGVAAVA